jgi:hypothetical protein
MEVDIVPLRASGSLQTRLGCKFDEVSEKVDQEMHQQPEKIA